MSERHASLRPNRLAAFLLIVMWLCVSLVPLAAMFCPCLRQESGKPLMDPGESMFVLLIFLAMLVGMTAGGITLLWVQLSTQVTDEGISQRRLLGKNRWIPWTDVTEAGQVSWVVIVRSKTEEIRVGQYLFADPQAVVDLIRQRTAK